MHFGAYLVVSDACSMACAAATCLWWSSSAVTAFNFCAKEDSELSCSATVCSISAKRSRCFEVGTVMVGFFISS